MRSYFSGSPLPELVVGRLGFHRRTWVCHDVPGLAMELGFQKFLIVRFYGRRCNADREMEEEDYQAAFMREKVERKINHISVPLMVDWSGEAREISVMRMQMGRNLVSLIAFTGLFVGFVVADWNILHKIRKKEEVRSSLKNYCESWRMNVELNNIRGFEVVPQECIEYVGKYMTSSQYKADSERAIEECALYLSNCCNVKGDGKDAWIFDVDDTLLSTLPYFKKHQFGGEKFNITSLEGWMRDMKAPALEHTLNFFHEVKGSGLKIFLISSRRECLRDATVDNLIKVGYHGWSGLILRGLEDEYKQVQNYKANARKKLVDEGYRLWGILGDQWSSFDGNPGAKRTFKLPNSLYYVS